jgi:hydroxymethylpyrimidine/phosphomethylpyrimidine kinase
VSDNTESSKLPVVLSFNVHDSSGASGITADIEAINSQACRSASVITCLSVQDSQMVSSLIPIDADIIVQSARAVLEDVPVDAIKIGLIGSDEGVEVIDEILQDYSNIPVVYDPMLMSSNGMELAEDDVIDAIRELLIPRCNIMTLSSEEAGMLLPEADNPAAMMNGLMNKGCDHVLLSGRREVGETVINKLYHNYRVIEQYEWPRLTQEFYGAGCTLSAALAALLARGVDCLNACQEAQNYCWQCLNHASRYGMGQLQPNRFYWMHEDE